MFKIVDSETIVLIDENNQRVNFITDGNGDYYFMLYSSHEVRRGDYYSFLIDESNPAYNFFKWFVDQEINYAADEKIRMMYPTSYFVIDNNEVKIADQNKPIMESEFVKISVLQNKIKLVFSDKFPSSIRVNGSGIRDHSPFFIPVIDLFNVLQSIKTNKIVKIKK